MEAVRISETLVILIIQLVPNFVQSVLVIPWLSSSNDCSRGGTNICFYVVSREEFEHVQVISEVRVEARWRPILLKDKDFRTLFLLGQKP
jgi:hypothetical protein